MEECGAESSRVSGVPCAVLQRELLASQQTGSRQQVAALEEQRMRMQSERDGALNQLKQVGTMLRVAIVFQMGGVRSHSTTRA